MREKNKAPNVKRQKKAAGPEQVAADAVRRAAEGQRDEMIEREFKLGQLSLAEVARRSGGYPPSPSLTRQCIVKRAEKGGWERSLLPAVQAQVKDQLLRDAAPEDATPSEVVSAAAARALGIVLEHRASLKRLKRITNILIVTVEGYLDGEIPIIPWLRPNDTLTSVVARLAQAQAKVCTLERQAFNVDAEPEKPPVEAVRFVMNFGGPQAPAQAPAEPEAGADVGPLAPPRFRADTGGAPVGG